MGSIEAEILTLVHPDVPPAEGSVEAKKLLKSLRSRGPTNRHTGYTPPVPKIPKRNQIGLVIPVTPAPFDKQNLTSWQEDHGVKSSEHHIFWSKSVFIEAGPLAVKFREHRMNRVLIPNFQHVRYHRRHNPFIARYPDFLLPDKDVMIKFLDEPNDVDTLNQNVNKLDRMTEGIDPFTPERVEEYEETVEVVSILCTRVIQSEIIFPSFIETAVTSARRHLPALFG